MMTDSQGFQTADLEAGVDTIIVVRRADGTIDRVSAKAKGHGYAGTIPPPALKAQLEQANLNAGQQIIGWEIETVTRTLRYCDRYTSSQGCPLHGEYCQS